MDKIESDVNVVESLVVPVPRVMSIHLFGKGSPHLGKAVVVLPGGRHNDHRIDCAGNYDIDLRHLPDEATDLDFYRSWELPVPLCGMKVVQP